MKKFIFLFLVSLLLSSHFVYSEPGLKTYTTPMVLADSVASGVLDVTKISEFLYYAQTLQDDIQSLMLFEKQVENTKTQIEMAVKNLKSAKDIKNWDNFKDWYNRELYLEKAAAESINEMSFSIGKKEYKLTDIMTGKGQGFAEAFADGAAINWDKEFTEEQRKEMWIKLGLTPSNYAYVQPFRQKARELTMQMFAAPDIQNKEYMKVSERAKELMDKLGIDKNYDDADLRKMSAQETSQYILEMQITNAKLLNDIVMFQAKQMQKQAVDDLLEETPYDTNPLGKGWPGGFSHNFSDDMERNPLL